MPPTHRHLELLRNAVPIAVGCVILFIMDVRRLGAEDTDGRTPAEHSLGWDKLTFGYAPLLQIGTNNLLPNAGFERGLEGWNTVGDVSLDRMAGEPCLRLGAKRDGRPASFQVSTSAKPGVLYELSFRYQSSDDLQWDYTDDDAGLVGWCTTRSAQKKETGTMKILVRRRQPDWVAYTAYLFTQEQTTQLHLQLGLNARKGSVFLSSLSLRETPISAAEQRQIITIGGKSHAELPRLQAPAGPTKLTVFHRVDPDAVFEHSRPRPQEIGRPIRWAATAGETVLAALAVFTPKPLSSLRVECGALRATDRTWLEAVPEIYTVRYHPRRSDYYGRGATWRWVADVLLPESEVAAVPADCSKVFWLMLRVPDRAAAGEYEGLVKVQAAGTPEACVPIHLRIYPFHLLDTPRNRWGLYGDVGRWTTMNDEQVSRELLDMKRHGIDVLEIPERGGKPIWEGPTVVGWQWDEQTLRVMPLLKQAGLRGPFRVWLEWLPAALGKKLGVPAARPRQSPEQWPETVAAAFRDSLKAIVTDFAKRKWGEPMFEGIDEPGYWKKGSPEAFAWQYRNAVRAGISTYCTSSYLPGDPLGQYLTYHCYSGCCFDGPQRAAEIVAATRAARQQPWFYATGSYSGQVGHLVHNRYGAGFIFYRSGVDGIRSWTFQRPMGNPFDDFSGRNAQPCITFPDPSHPGQKLDTAQWEGLRQGWYDFRYAATLAGMIADAKKSRHPLASSVERRFQALLAEMPWDADVFEAPPVTSVDCDTRRQQIAQCILQLKE